jgi:glyoxylase-like metal-dependent hydrolase (beta-lactamase superfamily II)
MPWHTITEIKKDIFRISEPFGEIEPRFGIATANMYLVVGEERAALVDTGMGIGDLLAAVREITPRPCTVLNTHFHWDHIGNNAQFDDISIHELEAHLLPREQDMSEMIPLMQTPAARAVLPPDFDPASYRIRSKPATRRLKGDDTIDLGGRQLRTLHIPGHSPGHLAFWEEASGALFTGDGAYMGPMYACFAGGDPAAFERSIRRLAALPDVTTICPSHNEPIERPGWLAELAAGIADARAGKIPGQAGDGFINGLQHDLGGYSIWLPVV